MKRSFPLALLLALFAVPLSGQTRLFLSVDHTLFRSSDTGKSDLEIHYSIPRSRLMYRMDEPTGKLNASVLIGMKMHRDTILVLEDVWKLEASVADTSELRTEQYLVDQRRYALPQGDYTLKVLAADASDPERKDTMELSFNIGEWAGDAVQMSEIQMCASLMPATDQSDAKFVKNTLTVIPNPRRTYGPDAPVLYYYVELYNAGAPFLTDDYTTRVSVQTALGSEVESIQDKVQKKRRAFDSFVEIGHLNVGTLPTGAYVMRFNLVDGAEKTVATADERFFVYNSTKIEGEDLGNAGDLLSSRFSQMSIEELDTEFEQAEVFSTKEERAMFASLSAVDAKRTFLAGFWQERDPNSGTPHNEAFAQFEKRLSEIRQVYKWFTRPAWKTARGR
ncbi:MAG TPA: GWxTD domain-containing protein, partial [Bacteroidota bacterium]